MSIAFPETVSGSSELDCSCITVSVSTASKKPRSEQPALDLDAINASVRTPPRYELLQMHMAKTGENLRFCECGGPTSLENLCHKLFTEITRLEFRLTRPEVQETDTAIISDTREDWVADNRYLAE